MFEYLYSSLIAVTLEKGCPLHIFWQQIFLSIFFLFTKKIFNYILLSKNLQMNIQIYLNKGNNTNTNTNNIWEPFYLNIWLFEYLCSSHLPYSPPPFFREYPHLQDPPSPFFIPTPPLISDILYERPLNKGPLCMKVWDIFKLFFTLNSFWS